MENLLNFMTYPMWYWALKLEFSKTKNVHVETPGIDQKHEKCLLIKNVQNRNKFFFALSRAFFVRKTFWQVNQVGFTLHDS